HVRGECNQLRRIAMKAVDIGANLTCFDLKIVADHPSRLLKSLLEHRGPCLCLHILRPERVEHTNVADALVLLSASCKGQCHPCAREDFDELAPLHSITPSARATTVGGKTIPRALAVRMFSKNSNFVGCSTGRLAGLT